MRPLDVGPGHHNGAGPALVGYGEMEEGGWRAGIVDDDPAGVLDVLEGAGEVLWSSGVGFVVEAERSQGVTDLQSRPPGRVCASEPLKYSRHLSRGISRLFGHHLGKHPE